jgi:two-component system CheB/CheR fusion protein
MVTNLQYPEMSDHAREVMRTLVFKETDIATNDQQWFTVCIMPYRTYDDRIDGLVITFVDISVAKKLEAELKKAIELLKKHNLDKA